jgi:hypothetical protein
VHVVTPHCRLARRARQHTHHADLRTLSDAARSSELALAGLDGSACETVGQLLSAAPHLHLAVRMEVDEPDGEVQYGDAAHCKVRCCVGALLCAAARAAAQHVCPWAGRARRCPAAAPAQPAHAGTSARPDTPSTHTHAHTRVCRAFRARCACAQAQVRVLLGRAAHHSRHFQLRGSAVRAFTPHNPLPRDEAWYFFLVDAASNAVWAWKKVRRPGGWASRCVRGRPRVAVRTLRLL